MEIVKRNIPGNSNFILFSSFGLVHQENMKFAHKKQYGWYEYSEGQLAVAGQ